MSRTASSPNSDSAKATATPVTMPRSEQMSRHTPLPHTAKPAQTAKVSAPAITLRANGGVFSPLTSSTCCNPTIPSSSAMMVMISPLITGCMMIRRCRRNHAIRISNSPAQTVMQATAGSPPAFAARIEGPR
jgi:hypothetical protein